MRRSISIYLELLRTAAALGVFLGHSRTLVAPFLSEYLGVHASECVAIFFVLSGFVIRFTTETKERDWTSYAIARIARIYSVAIPAIILTMATVAAAIRLNPGYIASLPFVHADYGPADVLSYLAFANELWGRHVVVGSAEPYWSLGFEVPYYLLFGVLIFATRLRAVLVPLWALVFGPKVLLFLPLWLLGVAVFDVTKKAKVGGRQGLMIGAPLWLASVAGYAILKFKTHHFGAVAMYQMETPAQILGTVAYFYAVALLVACNIVGFDLATRGGFVWPEPISRTLRWVAGGSFTLYLVHEPLIVFLNAAVPNLRATHLMAVGEMALVLILAYAIAEVSERRKSFFRRLASLPFNRMRLAAPGAAVD